MARHAAVSRRRELRRGLVALAKSLVLVVAVPLAIIRLWLARPLPGHLLSAGSLTEAAFWLHVVLVVLALLWVAAAASLARELAGAFGGAGDGRPNSWSSRWAGAIAALLLATSATSIATASLGRPTLTELRASPRATNGAASAFEESTPNRSVVVSAGECLADLARRGLGAPELWPALARENLGRLQPDGSRFVDANLLRAGWCLELPPTAVGAAPDIAAPHGTTRGSDGESHAAGGAGLPELALVGLGILTSAALVRRLRRLRRVADSLRAPGERLGAPSVEAGATEALLAPLGEGRLLDWIDVANHLLGAHGAPGELLLVRAGPEAVEFLFSEPGEAPAPFRARPGGRWWALPLESDLEDCRRAARGAGRLTPCLVPIGDDDEAVYLLGLGTGRRLVLEGPDEEVSRVLQGLLTALRVLPWAEELDIELLGLLPPPPEEQCYQLSKSSPAALHALAESPPTPRRETRPSWRREPLVMLAPDAGTGAEAAAAGLNGVAGVISTSGTGTERLEVRGRRGVLAPYGLELALAAPDPDQQHLIELLLAEASRSPTFVPLAPSRDAPVHDRALSEGLPVAGQVEVRLLGGAPELRGRSEEAAPRDAARVIELVAYLVLHGSRATVEEVSGALFGRAALLGAPRRLDLLLAAAHRVLGNAPDGRRLLRVEGGGHIELAPEVSSDWSRLRLGIASARPAPPEGAVELLRAALGLLDAPAFAAAAHYDWLLAEGLLGELRSEILDAAHHLATLALAVADRELARIAIDIGRHLEPASELLARDLIVLHSGAGEAERAAAVYAQLEAALGELGGNEPSTETRDLLGQLEQGHRGPGGS